MKIFIVFVTGLALLALGIFIGSLFGNEKVNLLSEQSAAVTVSQLTTDHPPTQLRENEVQSGKQLTTEATTPEPLLGKGEGERVKVVRVIDGDTIDVEIEGKTERVRYIGIDTPETVDPRKTVQCFGVEASKKNKELVESKMVRLEKDITDRDKYNRLLRYVYLRPQINADTETRINADNAEEMFINQELVAQGFAKSYSYPPDVRHQDRFVAAEKKARENKLGLWTACASTTPAVSATPTAAASAAAFSASCTIKGNINASGEKIYHLQGCGSYAKTTIDQRRGEQWFCSESEAQSTGWRKALNCP